MAYRNILTSEDKTLRKKSREVTSFDPRLHTLIDDMRETLKRANGVGLAAPQVGVLRRVVLVLELDEEGKEKQIYEMINPVILESSGEQYGTEGCLSVPGVYGYVTRPMKVKVRAQDRFGNYYEAEGEGLTARAFCHEIDHLDGHLYTELADKLYKDGEEAEDEE